MLNGITITGADDKTSVDSLLDLSWYYPFVEWGILFGRKENPDGEPRYPTKEWVESLIMSINEGFQDYKIAAHLCGNWVKHLGANKLLWSDIKLLSNFGRIQINKSYHDSTVEEIDGLINACFNIEAPVIWQNNGTFPIGPEEFNEDFNHMLFDVSGGKGVQIRNFPKPHDGIYCGYAGGIGPYNIRETIDKIDNLYPNVPYWLDMETNVRTNGDLDLDKVEQCLTVAKQYIQPNDQTD